ncbi:MAG: hypothetical protein ACTSRP_01450 [Candidatus Helarchaeota archaeon]
MKLIDKKEIEIYSIFKHSNKNYILFSIKGDIREYLYINSNELGLRSLLFGKDLKSFINSNFNNPCITCIECHLGNRIKGGVSLDKGEIVESNLSISECNEILKYLKKVLKDRSNLIDFF